VLGGEEFDDFLAALSSNNSTASSIVAAITVKNRKNRFPPRV
jgi:hypothetical protein